MKSEIKVEEGHVPPEALGENPSLLPPGFPWLLAASLYL